MTAAEKIIKNKAGLPSLAEILGSVSRAGKAITCSRDRFYRFQNLYHCNGPPEQAFSRIEHPGHLGVQNSYYVGSLKGLGRIYQQTFVDTYSKVAFAKLYDCRNALVAADILNARVIPWYEEQEVPLLRILTSQAPEYGGNQEHHEYRTYLAAEDIAHITNAPPPEGMICKHFHKKLRKEFYSVVLRREIFTSLEKLQEKLDAWIIGYNNRPISPDAYGKTPMQIFLDAKWEAQAKALESAHANNRAITSCPGQ